MRGGWGGWGFGEGLGVKDVLCGVEMEGVRSSSILPPSYNQPLIDHVSPLSPMLALQPNTNPNLTRP